MDKPDITVLMPVYNAERYLREAIDSMLQQTFQNFELLIIDDGSTDKSAQIICSYTDPRIRFIQNEKNIGVAATLNRGVNLSSTELIARMDADDISYPDRLQKQLSFFKSHPECVLLSTWVREINKNKDIVAVQRFNGAYYYYILNFECWIYHPSVMYRRSAVIEAGMYENIYAEDFDLWWKLSRKYKVYNLDEVLLDYRITDESISNVVFNQENQNSHRELLIKNFKYYTENKADLSYAEAECLRSNVVPILKAHNVSLIVNLMQKLKFFNKCVLRKVHCNYSKNDIAEAAHYKAEAILENIVPRLSVNKAVLLMVRLGCYRKLFSYLKHLAQQQMNLKVLKNMFQSAVFKI